MGLLNASPALQLNASFSPIFPAPGHVGLSSQSGALGLAILALASSRGVGLSTFVSVGNKADVSSNDLLEYWEEDAATRVILLYLESFGNPRRFRAWRAASAAATDRRREGRPHARRISRAAGSHTAALAANDVAVDALFTRLASSRGPIDEMFDIAACLDAQPLPAGAASRLSPQPGSRILAVDRLRIVRPDGASFSTETRRGWRRFCRRPPAPAIPWTWSRPPARRVSPGDRGRPHRPRTPTPSS